MARFSSTMDPVVSLITSLRGSWALPNDTLTGSSTSSSSSRVLDFSTPAGITAGRGRCGRKSGAGGGLEISDHRVLERDVQRLRAPVRKTQMELGPGLVAGPL